MERPQGGLGAAVDRVDEVIADRREKMNASENPWQPRNRERFVSQALRAYAHMATSASTGAVRVVPTSWAPEHP